MRHLERSCDGSNGAHHRHGPGGVHDVDRPCSEHLGERIGDQSCSSGAAVVGAHDQFGERSELVLEQHARAGARPDDGDHVGPELGESAGDREHHGCADTAGHTDRGACGDQIGRAAEWADDVVDRITGCERHEICGALAHRLDDEIDRPGCRVAVGNRQRYALGARTEPHDDELTGLTHGSNTRRTHDQPVNIGRQLRVRQHLVPLRARGLVIAHRRAPLVWFLTTLLDGKDTGRRRARTCGPDLRALGQWPRCVRTFGSVAGTGGTRR